MQFRPVLDQTKMCPELIVKRFGIVSQHLEPTALRGNFRTKCAHNDVAAALYRTNHILNICDSLCVPGQEMEYRTIMPKIIRTGQYVKLSHIREQPMDLVCSHLQALSRYFERPIRNIKNCDVPVTTG